MPKQVAATPPLVWNHAAHDIPEAGRSCRRAADAAELAAVAQALDLLVCRSLEADYTIKPSAGGRYLVSGLLRADLDQACVVTLDPVASVIEESIDVAFWPPEEMPAPASGAVDVSDEPDPEPIVAGQLEIGRVLFESLAAALDPFPRAPGAELERTSTAPGSGDADKPESPFAVLAKIKPKA